MNKSNKMHTAINNVYNLLEEDDFTSLEMISILEAVKFYVLSISLILSKEKKGEENK